MSIKGMQSKEGEAIRLYAVLEMRDGNWTEALKRLIQYLHITGQI
jgi:hypothetical protein